MYGYDVKILTDKSESSMQEVKNVGLSRWCKTEPEYPEKTYVDEEVNLSTVC